MSELPLLPKVGTIEAVVLNKLIASEDGITYLDFEDKYNMTDKKLQQIISNLQNGMFESDGDASTKMDS